MTGSTHVRAWLWWLPRRSPPRHFRPCSPPLRHSGARCRRTRRCRT